jgi:hypothetical protein
LTPEEAAIIKRNMNRPVVEKLPRPAVEMMPAPMSASISAPTPAPMSASISAPTPAPMPARVLSARARVEQPEPVAEETPRFASRNWRAEAWEREREREREQRAGNQHAKIPTRRRVN